MILYTHGGNWKLCWMNLVVLIHFPLPVQVQGTCTWRILRGNNWVKRNTVSTYIGEEETDKRGQQKSQRFQHGYKSALVRSAVYYVVCIWYWWGEGKKGNLRTGQVGSSNKPRRRRKRWLFLTIILLNLMWYAQTSVREWCSLKKKMIRCHQMVDSFSICSFIIVSVSSGIQPFSGGRSLICFRSVPPFLSHTIAFSCWRFCKERNLTLSWLHRGWNILKSARDLKY